MTFMCLWGPREFHFFLSFEVEMELNPRKFNSSPSENSPGHEGKGSSSNHSFFGAMLNMGCVDGIDGYVVSPPETRGPTLQSRTGGLRFIFSALDI